jgi:alanine dehydrogenase
MHIHPLDTEDIGLKTLEKHLIRNETEKELFIGVPREQSPDEGRVSLSPGGVRLLTANGHKVRIQQDAGRDAKFSDEEYREAGAEIVELEKEVFEQAEIVLKVAPLTSEELEWVQKGQTIISALHLGSQNENYFKSMLEKATTGIAYEYIKGADQEFPLVRMMHEITGSMAVQIAAHYLESKTGEHAGQGIMLGGISGVPPATVAILGAGITAEYAARTALGYGAQVFVMDNDLTALRRLENALDRRIITAVANEQYLRNALKFADVLIGSAFKEGETSSVWITEEMVSTMKEGSVLVDTVIDQGGCIESSKATTHSQPTFLKHGVTHYCVPNIPSKVARTGTYALNNVLVPYVLAIGQNGGIQECLWRNTDLRNGTYTYKGHLTKQSLGKAYGIPVREIEMLIASQI